jgi:hypothetical protein
VLGVTVRETFIVPVLVAPGVPSVAAIAIPGMAKAIAAAAIFKLLIVFTPFEIGVGSQTLAPSPIGLGAHD